MQTTDANAQLLRLYYLQQLGITAYVPRHILPGALTPAADSTVEAAASDDTDATVPLQQQVVTEDAVVERPVIVVEAEPVNEAASVRNVVVAESGAPPPARKAEVTPAVAAEQSMSPFQILFVVVNAELAVAAQIPAALKPALRDSDVRLLANVLRWLGFAWPAQAVPLQFRWPLPGLPATSAEQAGKGLQVFLEQAAVEQPFQRLLVFGNEAMHALRAGGGGERSSWQAWYTHSLAELLALPALKQETWQTLLPLRAQLSS